MAWPRNYRWKFAVLNAATPGRLPKTVCLKAWWWPSARSAAAVSVFRKRTAFSAWYPRPSAQSAAAAGTIRCLPEPSYRARTAKRRKSRSLCAKAPGSAAKSLRNRTAGKKSRQKRGRKSAGNMPTRGPNSGAAYRKKTKSVPAASIPGKRRRSLRAGFPPFIRPAYGSCSQASASSLP